MELYKLKVEKRNKLYFNKFKYKASLTIKGAAYSYYSMDIETFTLRIEKLRESKSRYGVRVLTDSWQEYWDEIDLDQISKFITWRNVISKERCLYRIQGDYVSFFSNDLALLHTLDCMDPNLKFYEAKSLSPDTMYFKKNPKYKYRTYFKGKRMPKDFCDNVRSLNDMYEKLKFSDALFDVNWHQFKYMHSSYFVEYNDEQMHTILAMWFPDMLAKTYICEKEP